MSAQAIGDLMARVGPLLDLHQITAFPEDLSWALFFDESTRLDVDYDEARSRAVVEGVVGAVEEHARLRVHTMLLQYNYLWRQHGGVRAALEGAPGDLVLLLDLPPNVDLPTLCGILQNFRNVVEEWRRAVANANSDGGSTAGADPSAGFLRI